MAVAVAGAFGAFGATAAFAQSSTVSLSGAINYNYGYFDNGGAGFAPGTAPVVGTPALPVGNGVPKVRTDALSNQESEWVMKGEEALGGGLSAYFQCSTSLDVAGTIAIAMCGRTSFIGFKGSFGSANFGNNDTPTKRMAANYDPFPISAAMGQGAQMWNATASNTANGTTPASFSRRQQNLVTYDMPTMNGFDASIAFTAANEATANTSASTIQKPRMWAASANYTNGPLMLGAGYERHQDYNAASLMAAGGVVSAQTAYAGGNDTMYTLAAAYTFMGSLKVSAVYNRISYNNLTSTVGLGGDMAVNTWGLYGDWAITGPHRVRLGYGNQGSTRGSYTGIGATTNGQVGSLTANGGAGQTGAQKFVVEYAYALSKRTEVGLDFATIRNDRFSNITIGTGSNNPNYGETQNFTGMMLRHKF